MTTTTTAARSSPVDLLSTPTTTAVSNFELDDLHQPTPAAIFTTIIFGRRRNAIDWLKRVFTFGKTNERRTSSKSSGMHFPSSDNNHCVNFIATTLFF